MTQKALAERLHMSVRTIIEIEKCKSNPKFETVALLAKELNISNRQQEERIGGKAKR